MSKARSIDAVRQTTHLGPEVVTLLQSYEARIANLERAVRDLRPTPGGPVPASVRKHHPDPIPTPWRCGVPDCGLPQFRVPGGLVCAEGHGGAPSLGDDE